MSINPSNAPCKVHNAVTGGYAPAQGVGTPDGNLIKLSAIVSLFGLCLGDVARAGGVSRPYVSRVLGGGLQPSAQFLRRLEGNLGKLIGARQGQVFSVESTPVKPAELVLAQAGNSIPS